MAQQAIPEGYVPRGATPPTEAVPTSPTTTQAPVPPNYVPRNATPADTGTTVTTTKESAEIPQPPPPSFFEELPQAAPSIFGRTGFRTFGFPADALEMVTQGIGAVERNVLGNSQITPELIHENFPLSGLTSEGLERNYEKMTGVQLYDPQNKGVQQTQPFADVIPSALTLGAGLSRNVVDLAKALIKYGWAPTAAGEIAKSLTQSAGLPSPIPETVGTVAEMATAKTGSLTRPNDRGPSLPALDRLAVEGFNNARAAGVRITQPALTAFSQSVVNSIGTNLGRLGRTGQHIAPRTSAMLEEFRALSVSGPLRLDDLHTLRQSLGTAISGAEGRDLHLLYRMRSQLDHFIDGLPNQRSGWVSGNAAYGVPQLRSAIDAYARARRSELIQETMRRARDRVNSMTGYNMDRSMRQEFRNLTLSRHALGGFSREERDAIRQISEGSPVAQALSGLAPSSNVGNIIRLGLGMTAGGFATGWDWMALAGVPTAGLFGKAASAAASRRDAGMADALVRGGAGSVPNRPMLKPLSMFYATEQFGQ